jgi:hypothetical protein
VPKSVLDHFRDSSDVFFGVALGVYVASKFEGMVFTVLRRYRGTGNRYLRVTLAVHTQLELPRDGRQLCVKAISVWAVSFPFPPTQKEGFNYLRPARWPLIQK